MENLEWRLSELENKFGKQISSQESKLKELDAKVKQLNEAKDQIKQSLQAAKPKAGDQGSASDAFVRRVEWKIDELKVKLQNHPKGESIWSPEFNAAGVNGMQLEFFPNGRESTNLPGFCSLFLWCPSGTKIRYQLWVGKHLRAPDEDEYDGRMGHGHSNFCMLSAETDGDSDTLTVGVDILDVRRNGAADPAGMTCVQSSFSDMLAKELQMNENKDVNRVEWKIKGISKRLKSLPRGSSLYSPHITMAGLQEILLEFYPNGSQNTTKEGHCAFYLRGPEGASVTVTLFVGNYKKGPIQTTFDGSTGKGLPEFCEVEKEIDQATDSLVVGVDLKNNNSDKKETVIKITTPAT